MSKIAREVAIADFNRWLDFKKVKENKRNESKAQIDEIVSAIEHGNVIIDDNCNIIQNLEFPITSDQGGIVLGELKFKPRILVHQLNAKLKGVEASNVDGRILAYASALTDQNSGIIGKLDTEDYRIVSSVVMFFL